MKKEEYNWWADPKNKDEVQRISWWNHPENMETFPLPISVINTENDVWVATFNADTEKLLGEAVHGVAQGKTKEEAIAKMFLIAQFAAEYTNERMLAYQRWVPLRVGPWKSMGGRWVSIFGINIYFRYGKNMKRGVYIPLTKLNISIHSEWRTYRNYMKRKAEERESKNS